MSNQNTVSPVVNASPFGVFVDEILEIVITVRGPFGPTKIPITQLKAYQEGLLGHVPSNSPKIEAPALVTPAVVSSPAPEAEPVTAPQARKPRASKTTPPVVKLTKEELKAKVIALGGNGKGLHWAKEETLLEKIAALEGKTAPAAPPAKTALDATAPAAPPAKKGFKGKGKPMQEILISKDELDTQVIYTCESLKVLTLWALCDNDDDKDDGKVRVFNPSKDQTGVAKGFVKGCSWRATEGDGPKTFRWAD